MIVADTDVLIDFLRGRNPAADRVAREIEAGSFATTAITAFELRSGVRSERQKRAVAQLLGVMAIVSVGAEEAALAADLRLSLESRGQSIGMADCLIAGTCLAKRAILLTKNRKHFERVSGLSLASLSPA